MIAVIDYGAGNLRSIRRALEAGGRRRRRYHPTRGFVRAADAVVLPGVGHAGHSVDRLISLGMDARDPRLGRCRQTVPRHLRRHAGALRRSGRRRRSRSRAAARAACARSPKASKTPHMGWNRSRIVKDGPLGAVDDEAFYYFVHSFVAEPADPTTSSRSSNTARRSQALSSATTFGECSSTPKRAEPTGWR